MATSLAARVMLFGDGLTYPGQDQRLSLSAQMTAAGTAGSTGLASRGGVRLTGAGTPLAVTAGSGLAVNVAVGQCYVPAASGDDGGLYVITFDTAGSLTVATANPSNPRIDLVYALITDLGTSSSTATIAILTGTAAASPSPPATPSDALALAHVNVAAGASSVTVTDVRTYTAALGGILPVTNSAAYPSSAAASDYGHNLATGRLVLFTGSGNATAPATAAFAPQTGTGDTGVSTSTAWSTGAQAVVSCDGLTRVQVLADVGDFTFGGSVGNGYTWAILRDGSPIKQYTLVAAQVISNQFNGQLGWWEEVPSSGTHTYAIGVACQASSGTSIAAHSCTIQASAVSS